MDERHMKRIAAIRDGIDEAESIGALSFTQSSNMAYLIRMLEDENTALLMARRVMRRNLERATDALTVADNIDLLRAIVQESTAWLAANPATEAAAPGDPAGE